MTNNFDTTEKCAKDFDAKDSLAKYREQFFIQDDIIYMDGNSLGLLSKESEKAMLRIINEWKTIAIGGWLEPEQPWFYFSEKLGEKVSSIVGAKPVEVVATGTTTVNIHALISSFYKPKGKRTKILADVLNFPTDIYALQSQIMLQGLDPKEHLILAPSEDGRFLDEEKIVELMTDEIAVALLPSVLYRSGQLLDMEYLTKEAHKKGILIGFDCSHSVGTVPHKFDDWDIDFALWCSYKYMNGGPGSSAFLYVNEKHFDVHPGLTGWFGNVKETQFNMVLDFEPAHNAGRWQISSPGILGAAAIEGALNVTLDAGIDAIREKSIKQTSYLIYLYDEILSKEPYNFILGAKREHEKRGGHIALQRDEYAFEICEALKARNVVPDFRQPNVVRIAPAALYNTYHDIWNVVHLLKEIIDNKEFEKFIQK
ncbi:MAG: kynureninase [Candidatus Heimdallarchaeota archaeon]